MFFTVCICIANKLCPREKEERVERAQKKGERSNEARSNTIHRGRMKQERRCGDSDLICTNVGRGNQQIVLPLYLLSCLTLEQHDFREKGCHPNCCLNSRANWKGRNRLEGKPHAREITLCKASVQNLAGLAVTRWWLLRVTSRINIDGIKGN